MTDTFLDSVVARPEQGYLLFGKDSQSRAKASMYMAIRLACDGNGDDDCRICHQVAAGSWPDLLVLAPGAKEKVGVAAVRDLTGQLARQPYSRQGHRVVVVPEAQTLTVAAQNALLKVLEEPPAGTTIILTADRPGGVLATVRSRLAEVSLGVISALETQSSDIAGSFVTLTVFARLCGAKTAAAGNLESLGASLHLYYTNAIKAGRQSAHEAIIALSAVERFRIALISGVSSRPAYERLCLELPCI